MKILRILAVLPIILVLAVIARVLGFGGLVTIREDSSKMVEAFWAVIDAMWAWFETPPLWVTVVALAIMTGAYILNQIGAPRLLHVLSFLFRQDTRRANLQKISGDDGVKLAKDRHIAGHLLNHIDWSPISNLEEFGDEVVVTDAMDHLSLSARCRVVRQAIDEKEIEIRERLTEIESALGLDASEPLRNVIHHLGSANITPCKAGPDAKFPDAETCKEWCSMQGKVNRVNRVLDELQRRLRRKVNEPVALIPSEEWLSQLLQDIE